MCGTPFSRVDHGLPTVSVELLGRVKELEPHGPSEALVRLVPQQVISPANLRHGRLKRRIPRESIVHPGSKPGNRPLGHLLTVPTMRRERLNDLGNRWRGDGFEPTLCADGHSLLLPLPDITNFGDQKPEHHHLGLAHETTCRQTRTKEARSKGPDCLLQAESACCHAVLRGHRRSLRLIARVNMQTFRFERQPGPPFLRWLCKVLSFAGKCADCLSRLCFPPVALVRSNVPQERWSASNMPRMTVSLSQSRMPMQRCCFGCSVTILQRQLPHSPACVCSLGSCQVPLGRAGGCPNYLCRHITPSWYNTRNERQPLYRWLLPTYACNQNMK